MTLLFEGGIYIYRDLTQLTETFLDKFSEKKLLSKTMHVKL